MWKSAGGCWGRLLLELQLHQHKVIHDMERLVGSLNMSVAGTFFFNVCWMFAFWQPVKLHLDTKGIFLGPWVFEVRTAFLVIRIVWKSFIFPTVHTNFSSSLCCLASSSFLLRSALWIALSSIATEMETQMSYRVMVQVWWTWPLYCQVPFWPGNGSTKELVFSCPLKLSVLWKRSPQIRIRLRTAPISVIPLSFVVSHSNEAGLWKQLCPEVSPQYFLFEGQRSRNYLGAVTARSPGNSSCLFKEWLHYKKVPLPWWHTGTQSH